MKVLEEKLFKRTLKDKTGDTSFSLSSSKLKYE
jgi:hypothetical protein